MLLAAAFMAAIAAPAAPVASAPSGTTPPVAGATAVAAASPAAPDPNRKVCKAEVVTGTHMVGRVCKTQAEWDLQSQQTSRWLDQTRDGEGLTTNH
jgi:hypothetical protein